MFKYVYCSFYVINSHVYRYYIVKNIFKCVCYPFCMFSIYSYLYTDIKYVNIISKYIIKYMYCFVYYVFIYVLYR